MIRCKICEVDGVIAEFKDGRGLNFHLRSKHGMNLQKYKEIYSAEKLVEEEEKAEEMPILIEKVLEEKSKEVVIDEDKLPNITNFQYIKQQYTVIFTEDDIREVIALGTVELDGCSSVSVLVMDETGHLIPPNWVSDKYNLVNENKKKIEREIIKNRRQGAREFKRFPRLKKDILKPKPQPADPASMEKLMEKLMEFNKK